MALLQHTLVDSCLCSQQVRFGFSPKQSSSSTKRKPDSRRGLSAPSAVHHNHAARPTSTPPCIPLLALPHASRDLSARAASSLLSLVPEHRTESLDIPFPALDAKGPCVFDLAVVGAGPAGLSVAHQVAEQGLSVCCVDPAPESVWPNNYGVWVDEFEAMDLLDCLDYVWPKAVVYLDDDKEKYLDRPYGRVDRRRLKRKMGQKCADAGVQFHKAKVDSVSHRADGSELVCVDGVSINATLVLDATGFSRRLIQFDKPWNPGYQAAWGIVAEVDSHPFDLDTMVFMDWRDSQFQGKEHQDMKQRNIKLPTFLYAMPLSPTRVFLEETSLVARPAVGFAEIQERMELRLKRLGITIKSIEEEEYCLIPMGGVLPTVPQRVLGIGGTAGMVHPSTGYMVARTLAAAPIIARSIVKQLRVQGRATSAEQANGSAAEGERSVEADAVAAAVWRDIWPRDRREQREFFCFGMDVLLRLDLNGNRRFFDAFFDLSPYNWHGFLSQRLNLPELIGFGLELFRYATTPARLEIMAKGTPGLVQLIQNVMALQLTDRPPAAQEKAH